MRKYAMQQHRSMLSNFELCKRKALDEEKEIECCYQVCTQYWRKLQHALAAHDFVTEAEEIDFFKNVKPLFTSEIEYYSLMYHALLFKPMYGDENLFRFWLRELQRLEKFTETNIEFYHYLKNKDTNHDQLYFLRAHNEFTDVPEANMTAMERKTAASHDHVLSGLMALEKYTVYVQSQIEKLNQVNHGN